MVDYVAVHSIYMYMMHQLQVHLCDGRGRTQSTASEVGRWEGCRFLSTVSTSSLSASTHLPGSHGVLLSHAAQLIDTFALLLVNR
jgi:hypothetical protein